MNHSETDSTELRRIAQTTRLLPERRDEYLTLHSAVWPGVEGALRAANIRNYSIFLAGDLLFAYYEYHGDDWEADLATVSFEHTTWLAPSSNIGYAWSW